MPKPLPHAPIARPRIYGPVEWWQDVFNASRDGRVGLPDADAVSVGEHSALTPHIETLTRAFEDSAERERIRALRDLAAVLHRRAVERASVDEHADALVAAQEELTGVGEPEAVELEVRRIGEDGVDSALVRERRRREYEKRVAPLRAEVRRQESGLLTARAALARTEGVVDVRVGLAAARVARLHAHVLRRIAVYERRLLRVHPAPHQLRARLPLLRPVLPAWTHSAPAALPL